MNETKIEINNEVNETKVKKNKFNFKEELELLFIKIIMATISVIIILFVLICFLYMISWSIK